MSSKYEIPDRVTMGQIRELAEIQKPIKTITEWQRELKKYAEKHELTDQQVIAMANKGRYENEN